MSIAVEPEIKPEVKIEKPVMITQAIRLALTPFKILQYLCMGVGAITLVLCAALGLYVYSFFHGLPDLDTLKFGDLKKMAQYRINKKLEDKNRRYRWVELAEVNRDLLYAIVMSEDATFFEHDGLEIDSMLDSLANNIKKRKIESGGSTITQQTVKNLFLSDERRIVRKLREVLLTKDLEEKFTKNEILELYFNLAEFGPDIVGVNAAAHKYFQKGPGEINAAEGAFLALMLPSPRRLHYSVFENHNLTKAHRNKIRRILGDMLHNEYISLKQYNDYLRYDFFDDNHRTPMKRKSTFQRGIASKHRGA